MKILSFGKDFKRILEVLGSPGGVWEGFWEGFTRVFIVFLRFWEVLGGFRMVL